MNLTSRIGFSGLFCLLLGLVLPNLGFSSEKKVKDDRVNLVMRKVGDQLLRKMDDSTSLIPAVSQTGNIFSLRLDRPFKYELLPEILNQALKDAKIENDYHLVVRSCAPSPPILGFTKQDLIDGQIPCKGREQHEDCNIIELTIYKNHIESAKTSASSNDWMLIPLIVLLFAGGLYYFSKKTSDLPEETNYSESLEEEIAENKGVTLGATVFDAQNQTITIGEEQKSLTFRETKILKIFADQPNQIVKRETLIDEVWGNEGVIVGRSLDVFISRLRKILKSDDAVNITNIHGVGYKLEVVVAKS